MSYSLGLYSPISDSGAHIATVLGGHIQNITDMAEGWKRSIRLQGGYWLGSFRIYDTLSGVRDWFTTKLGYHIVEKYANQTTWEGYISSMYPQDIKKPYYVDCIVSGYIFTSAWRYVTQTSGLANASTWISTILTNDCPFLTAGTITTNALQVSQECQIEQRAWDELCRVTELGGEVAGPPTVQVPWRLYVTSERRVNYEPISTTPLYYARGGLIRARSLDDMWNYITGKYIDNDGWLQSGLTPASNAVSISRYGRREFNMNLNDVSATVAEARRDATLKESAYPWARPIGSISNIKLYDINGADVTSLTPWLITPGVVRDVRWPATGQESGGWLEDARDMLVDEVVADRNGVTLKSLQFAETDLIDLLWRNQLAIAAVNSTSSGAGGRVIVNEEGDPYGGLGQNIPVPDGGGGGRRIP